MIARLILTLLLSSTLTLPLAHAAAENWLGLPVTYKADSYAFKSGPALALEQLQLGTREPMHAATVWLLPDWADWITTRSMRRFVARSTVIEATPESLSRLGVVDGPSTRLLSRLEFEGLSLRLGARRLQLPAGEMRFLPDGALDVVRVALEEGVSVELRPRQGGRLGVLVQAGTLRWPVLPAFGFTGLVAQGELGNEALVFDRIGANADGGAISGMLKIVAPDVFRLEGEMKMNSLRVADVLKRLFPKVLVDGRLSGSFKLAAEGEDLAALAASARVAGDYALRAGSIDRFGLLEGMRRSGGGMAGGGLVRFDDLNGRFAGAAGKPLRVEFRGLRSGALGGAGELQISADGQLGGSVYGTLQLPGGDRQERSFALSGRVDAPVMTTR